ncbi:MAG TPA: leucine-rich repeat domain-containing protein, partial [Gallicola sp.]|nr:leucine-rich repeat domain-containing protein [Gallicola sp.]
MKKLAKKIILPLLLLSLFCVTGCSNNTPYVGENGNWWVGESDTGVPAQGDKGDKGDTGDKGDKGDKGDEGTSVTVISVEKTSSDEKVDTYTITFSDGTTSDFTVTNGEDGDSVYVESVSKISSEGLIDTYKIVFSDGSEYTFTVTNGEDGECVTIESIEKTSSEELVDTYTITLSDGNKFTFTVTNGKDGLTPYIGPNGNWWIGDEDTGEFASYNYETRDITDGLTFTPMTINGQGGFVVTGFEPAIAFGAENWDLLRNDPDRYAKVYGTINIPDYLGTTPVIGVTGDLFDDLDYIGKVSLSKNTVYLGEGAFENCSNLEEFDFNGAKIEILPSKVLYKTSIKNIVLPDTLIELGDYSLANTKLLSIEFPDSLEKLGNRALYGNAIKNIDVNNVSYFGEYSLAGSYGKAIYLTKDVEYVGSYAFQGSYVYLEHEVIPSTWGSNIAGTSTVYGGVVTPNCLINDEYIYSKEGLSVTVYNYIGEEKRISVPSMIDSLPVTKIGYGFNSINYSAIDAYFEQTNASDGDVINAFIGLEEVVLPNTVKSIDLGTFA